MVVRISTFPQALPAQMAANVINRFMRQTQAEIH